MFDNLFLYSNNNDFTEGIFGQSLVWLIEVLYYFEYNNLINDDTKIIFELNTLNTHNLIPTFINIKKIEEYDYSYKKLSIHSIKLNTKARLPYDENSWKICNNIFNKYFKFNDYIINEVNKLNITDNTLGIHYRGTDKNYDTSQANYITIDEMIMIIEDYLNNNINIKTLFCCSDEQIFINKIKEKFKNYKIIEYNQFRNNSENINYGLFRYGEKFDEIERNKLTYASIIDMLALSKCKVVIKSSSALSTFSKIINPSLILYTVSAMKKDWFPHSYVEEYKTNNIELKKILQRTMKNHYYNIYEK
tara:strand:+ start:746 stop:1660 length:915 start_codon:yes stop_codon:yes gene_type:complete